MTKSITITVKCKYCEKEFTTTTWNIKNNRGKFCSHTCSNKYRYSIPNDDRFWDKVEKTVYCWEWKASKTKFGYGKFRNKLAYTAHRYSYFIHFGEIMKDMHVCHKCDNPSCVNPDHLFIGTMQDNMRDRDNKNRTAKGIRNGSNTKPERRARGSRCGSAKLTENDVIEIRKMYLKDHNRQKIADVFSVTAMTIYYIVKYETWKHVA